MKSHYAGLLSLLLISCSSARFVDSWKNDSLATSFQPDQVLVMAMTENQTARRMFEDRLANEFRTRLVGASQSYTLANVVPESGGLSEEDLDRLSHDLSAKGFDAILITSVKGVDVHHQHDMGYTNVQSYYGRFGRYYYLYQDIYYQPDRYIEYDIYHVESAYYTLGTGMENNLVWVGSFDLINPRDIGRSADDYIASLLRRLEKEGILAGN